MESWRSTNEVVLDTLTLDRGLPSLQLVSAVPLVYVRMRWWRCRDF